jgi:hypothetical protein
MASQFSRLTILQYNLVFAQILHHYFFLTMMQQQPRRRGRPPKSLSFNPPPQLARPDSAGSIQGHGMHPMGRGGKTIAKPLPLAMSARQVTAQEAAAQQQMILSNVSASLQVMNPTGPRSRHPSADSSVASTPTSALSPHPNPFPPHSTELPSVVC